MDFAFVCQLWLANEAMLLPNLHVFLVGLFANKKAENRKPNQIINTNIKFKLTKLKATVCYITVEGNTYSKPHSCLYDVLIIFCSSIVNETIIFFICQMK